MEALSQIPILATLPPDGLARLVEQGVRRSFSTGAALMRQGEPSACMHVILMGSVQVERTHPDLIEPVVLAELGAGEAVGEMGVLDGEPRSATVIALEETETMELSATQLADAVVRYPEVSAALLRTITRRLRSTDELVAEVLRRERSQRAEEGATEVD